MQEKLSLLAKKIHEKNNNLKLILQQKQNDQAAKELQQQQARIVLVQAKLEIEVIIADILDLICDQAEQQMHELQQQFFLLVNQSHADELQAILDQLQQELECRLQKQSDLQHWKKKRQQSELESQTQLLHAIFLANNLLNPECDIVDRYTASEVSMESAFHN